MSNDEWDNFNLKMWKCDNLKMPRPIECANEAMWQCNLKIRLISQLADVPMQFENEIN